MKFDSLSIDNGSSPIKFGEKESEKKNSELIEQQSQMQKHKSQSEQAKNTEED